MKGSVQLRRFLRGLNDGLSTKEAADLADIGMGEAVLHAEAHAAGEYADIDLTIPSIGHNSGDIPMSNDHLRLFIERIERLEEEKRGISDDIKDIYAEAKANGYDPKIMRIIVRDRKMEKHVRDERDALIDVYRNALGMLADTPLGQAAMRAAA